MAKLKPSTDSKSPPDQLPHPRRRERQLVRLDAERSERRRHRIGDDAADRNDAAFAGALGAERIVGRGLLFERHRPDGREVARGRHAGSRRTSR